MLDAIAQFIMEFLGYAAFDRATNPTQSRFMSFCAALFCMFVVYCCLLLMIYTPIDAVRVGAAIFVSFFGAAACLLLWKAVKP